LEERYPKMDQFEEMPRFDAWYVAVDIWRLIMDTADNKSNEEYFDLYDPDIVDMFSSPKPWTLLHHFIYEYEEMSRDDFEHHCNDMLDLVVLEYTTTLKGYGILLPNMKQPSEADPDYEDVMQRNIELLRAELPVMQITHEAFQLLFGDRAFLYKFNLVVAEVVRNMKLSDYPVILERDGMLLRPDRLPRWLETAVTHRDKASCVLCGVDLSGALRQVQPRGVHFDHIVPLSLGGTNDPTNFQLLCKPCNLKKGETARTSNFYSVYWPLP
jgi:hypothetical protein